MLKIIMDKDSASVEEDAKAQVAQFIRRPIALIPALDAAQIQSSCYECGKLFWKALSADGDYCDDCRGKADEDRELERNLKRAQIDAIQREREEAPVGF